VLLFFTIPCLWVLSDVEEAHTKELTLLFSIEVFSFFDLEACKSGSTTAGVDDTIDIPAMPINV
jgi:hypothetical protein